MRNNSSKQNMTIVLVPLDQKYPFEGKTHIQYY